MKGHMGIDIGAGLAMMAFAAYPATAHAETVTFGASGVAGALTLSLMADANTGSLPSSPPNSVDPIGAEIIDGASGTFSDAAAGLTNEGVTGVVARNYATPETSNQLAPHSFSFLKVTDGVSEGGVTSLGLHYDNLFYPGGSPQTASDYKAHGGILDIYGLVFTLANGDDVNFWSNGVSKTGLTYGVAVTNGTSVLDYNPNVLVSSVPLPAAAPMFGAALVALGMAGYGLKKAKAAA